MMPYRIPSFRAEVRMLYEKTGRRLYDTERRIYDSDDALPSPRITVTDSLLSFWAMSFGLRHHAVFCSPLIMTRFPKIVILNGGKNTVVERQETGWWRRVKKLLLWWRFTVLYKDHIVKEYLAISWQLTADSFYLHHRPSSEHLLS